MNSESIILHSSISGCISGLSSNKLPSIDLTSNEFIFQSNKSLVMSDSFIDSPQTACKIGLNSIENELLIEAALSPYLTYDNPPISLLYCASNIYEKVHREQIVEYLFEDLGISNLYMTTEKKCLLSFILNTPMCEVSVNNSLQKQNLNIETAKLISTSPELSCIILYSDYSEMRIRLLLSGYDVPRASCRLPYGDYLPICLLHNVLHQIDDKNKKVVDDSNNKKNTQYRHQCCWNLARLLYEKSCFVSLDTEVDSWLMNTKVNSSRKLSECSSDHSNDLCTVMSEKIYSNEAPISEIANQLPDWFSCTNNPRMTEFRHYFNPSASYDEFPCCISSHVPNTISSSSSQNNKKENKLNLDPVFFYDRFKDPLISCRDKEWESFISSSAKLQLTLQKYLKEFLFLPSEIFFQPKSIFSYLDSSETESTIDWNTLSKSWAPQGIHETLLDTFDTVPIDLRRDIQSNIIILGTVGCLPFFPQRLVNEIQIGLYNKYRKLNSQFSKTYGTVGKISVTAWTPPKPILSRYAVWIGAKYLSSDERIQDLFVNKEEYLEKGFISIEEKFDKLNF